MDELRQRQQPNLKLSWSDRRSLQREASLSDYDFITRDKD